MLLRRRLVLLFAAIVVVVLVVAALGALVIHERDDSRASERRLSVAQEEVAQLSAAYSDQETAVRGFVLAGDERFLAPYTTGLERASKLTTSLQVIARDEGSVRGPLTRVLHDARQWRTVAAEPAISARRAGDVSAAATAASTVGIRLFNDLRGTMRTLTGTVDNGAAVADSHAATARNRLTVLMVVFICVALAGTLIAAALIRRWVTRPVEQLGEQVRRVRAGESGSAIEEVGPPEIAGLAADIEAMRERIELQATQAEHSRATVEQSAAVLLTLRAQLEPDLSELPRGWTVAAQLRAAEGVVAGDCYGLVRLDDDALGLVVVDIAGHGAVEGILALRCKELLRASLAAGYEPGTAIEAAARQLGDLGEEVFLTTFVAVIDTRTGTVHYANAGHPPAFVASDERVDELGPTGPLVGLLDARWGTAVASVGEGDTLCAYTDGLIEVRRSEDREFFGPDRLVELVQGARCDQAPAVVKRCLDEVETFAAGTLRDDATIVVLCRP
jgi:sigma-B regulation protein RsbU (phosphoserine phosphatase)